MKNIVNSGSALERLKKLIPPGVQPKFTSAAELLAWQREEGQKRCEELGRLNQKARTEKIFGRSGIQSLHRSCTFANYEVSSEQQRKAYTMAKSYAQNFGNGFASFVFSGGPGTGDELDQMIWKLERDGMTPKMLSLMRELRERRVNAENLNQPVSETESLPLGYLQGHKDGQEWSGKVNIRGDRPVKTVDSTKLDTESGS